MAADRPAPVPRPIGSIAEPVYRRIVNARNRGFDAGRRVTRLPVPVISVGNLSVGGTGKTPMVRWVVETLRSLGRHPGVAMRGYGAAPGQPSDEQREHADRMPGVPVVANARRVDAARELIEEHQADAIVLDDGFQHRFIARDLDIVLIDATRSPFADRCLPAGWLREPAASLSRAGAVVITRTDLAEPGATAAIEAGVREIAPNALIARSRHAWSCLETPDGEQPIEWLRGRAVVAACAIGNPEAFVAQAESAGARIVGRLIRRDHHEWTRADADRFARSASGEPGAVLLTTHKDWVKWRRIGDARIDAAGVRPVVDLEFDDSGPGLRRLIAGSIDRTPDSVI